LERLGTDEPTRENITLERVSLELSERLLPGPHV
jgi:hypothetical protein